MSAAATASGPRAAAAPRACATSHRGRGATPWTIATARATRVVPRAPRSVEETDRVVVVVVEEAREARETREADDDADDAEAARPASSASDETAVASASASASASADARAWAVGLAAAVGVGVASLAIDPSSFPRAPSSPPSSPPSWSWSSSSSRGARVQATTPTTGHPAGATCGTFSAARTAVARDVLTCNQDNWEAGCLSHYSEDVTYVDGPGLTNVRGKDAMARYLKNQFDFSRQYLTVSDETCVGDTYVARWSLDMDLGTGNLRGMPGISVLKFATETDEDAAGEGGGAEGAEGAEGGGGGSGGGASDAARATAAGAGGATGDRNAVRYHRDYLPDGKIWENAPVVGPLVKFQRATYTACMLSESGCADLLGAPK